MVLEMNPKPREEKELGSMAGDCSEADSSANKEQSRSAEEEQRSSADERNKGSDAGEESNREGDHSGLEVRPVSNKLAALGCRACYWRPEGCKKCWAQIGTSQQFKADGT